MKIAMVASEANPFVKSGGLADVVYALSKELVTFGHEVAILLPYYKSAEARLVKKPMFKGALHFNMSWRDCYGEVYELVQDGITYYFIKNEQYFGRDGLYGYGDDGERFAFFTLAARNALPLVGFQPDIIHVHDWQSGMLPALIKVQNHNDPFYQKTRFVMTIHNPAFKGMLDPSALDNLYNLPYSIYENGSVRFEDRVSTLKSGIVYADKVTTVSPNHRNELLTSPQRAPHARGLLGLRGRPPYEGIRLLRLRQWHRLWRIRPGKGFLHHQDLLRENHRLGQKREPRSPFQGMLLGRSRRTVIWLGLPPHLPKRHRLGLFDHAKTLAAGGDVRRLRLGRA